MPATFKTSSGGDPVQFVLSIVNAAKVTQGDLLYAAQRQRARILERTTERGVDSNGAAFAPYNTDGPYYYYPEGHSKRASESRKRSIGRLAKKVGGKVTRNGLGIRFESYADFKQSLGRSVVDLMGPMARMVKAVVVKLGGLVVHSSVPVGLTQYATPAASVLIGLYGQESLRGEGHNTGAGHLPRRHWFDTSQADVKQMERDIVIRREAVLKGIRE